MSTKFQGIAKTQKPPSVCRKPPEPSDGPLPPLPLRDLQAYADWYDPHGTEGVSLVLTFDLQARPLTNSWIGKGNKNGYNVALEITHHLEDDTFDYVMTLLLHNTPADVKQLLNQTVRSVDPFDTGLIMFPGSGVEQRYYARAYT